MNPYRMTDPAERRRAVLAEASRVRDALLAIPRIHNIGTIANSREITDVLTRCIEELTA